MKWTIPLMEVIILQHEALGIPYKEIAKDLGTTYAALNAAHRDSYICPTLIKQCRADPASGPAAIAAVEAMLGPTMGYSQECLDFCRRYPKKASLNDYCSHPAYGLVKGPPSANVLQ